MNDPSGSAPSGAATTAAAAAEKVFLVFEQMTVGDIAKALEDGRLTNSQRVFVDLGTVAAVERKDAIQKQAETEDAGGVYKEGRVYAATTDRYWLVWGPTREQKTTWS